MINTQNNKPILWVSCLVCGGLGNQLFQIFNAISYGIKYNRKIIFQSVIPNSPRHTYWDTFLKHLFIFTTGFKPNGMTDKMLYGFPVYQEGEGFSHIEIPEVKMTNVRLYGYYQSYKYFEHYQTNIYNLVKINRFRDSILEKYGNLYLSREIPTVSMHFRIGDYVKLADYHPVLSYMYYEHALSYLIRELGEKLCVLVFCQQTDMSIPKGYVDQFYQSKFPNIEFVFVENKMEDWEEMLLMSLADHHIIANSTFSWWGAYIGKSLHEGADNKIVCYPDMWFGYEYMNNNTNDLFPPSWTKIDAAMPQYRFTWS